MCSFSSVAVAQSFAEELNKAYSLSKQGKLDESLSLLKELEARAKTERNISSVLSQRARTYEKGFRWQEALKTYERLYELAKDKPELKYSFTSSERSIASIKGKLARLEAQLKESQDRENAEEDQFEKLAIRAERSTILMSQGSFDQAIDLALAGIYSYRERGLKPPKNWHLNVIGSLLIQQNFQKAVEIAQGAYSDYPTSANLGLVAVLKMRAEDLDGAWEIFDDLFVNEKLIEDMLLASFYSLAIQKENYAKAVAVYEKANALGFVKRGYLERRYSDQSIMRAMSKSQQHHKVIDFVEKENSKHGPTYTQMFYLAKAHNAQGNYKKAEKMIKQNLRRLAPEHHSELNTDLAKSYLGRGKIRKALKTAKKAVKQDKQNQEATDVLLQIESQLKS